MRNKGLLALLLVLTLLLGAVGGFILHDVLTSQQVLLTTGLTRQQLRALNEAQSIIDKYAIEEHDDEAVVASALKGMASSLDDPYAYYYTPEEMQAYQQSSSGVITGGIGAEVTLYNGEVVVTELFKGMAADAAGIRPGDVLTAVDGQSLAGMTLSEAVALVKGEEGTDVTITLRRDDKELSFVVTRTSGQRQMTEYAMMPGGILYIRIDSFHGNAAEYFRKAIEYGREQSFTGVIIDLRENLGGDVSVFEKIADIMLPAGETFYAKARNGQKVMTCSSDASCVDQPVCVLVNALSASASEALAGALRDMGGAKLVGVKTYGKGIMQTSYPLSNGGVFKLTTAYYYLPGGDCIHEKGLAPDYEVALPEELDTCYWLRNEENDLQLKKAIELLTNNE